MKGMLGVLIGIGIVILGVLCGAAFGLIVALVFGMGPNGIIPVIALGLLGGCEGVLLGARVAWVSLEQPDTYDVVAVPVARKRTRKG